MGLEEPLDGGRAVVGSTILDQEHGLGRLRQDGAEEGHIACPVEPASVALIKQPPAEEVNQPEDLVGLALAGGRDDRLLTHWGPGVAERAPLGKPGFIAEQKQATGRGAAQARVCQVGQVWVSQATRRASSR